MAAGGRHDRVERAFGAACVLATAFVIYASLVPLAYAPQPLDVALQRLWSSPPTGVYGVERADWLANLGMFAPLSFSALAALGRTRGRLESFVRGAAAIVGFALVAVAIEIAQLWFPPRTVAPVDLVAAFGGIVVGALAHVFFGARALAWARPYFGDAAAGRALLALGFAIAYVALALFPFDIVRSAADVRAKLAGGNVGVWTAPAACSITVLCVGGAAALFVASLVFGVACRVVVGARARGTMLQAAVLGIAVGSAIELAQLFLASGVVQGSSVLARSLGIAIGYRLARRLGMAIDVMRRRPLSRPVLVVMALGYVALLALANRVVTTQWLSPDEALARVAQLPLLPFYYHYFVSEQRAIASAVAHLAMYAPVGAWVAIARNGRGGPSLAAWAAALVALAVESAKLLAGRQADTTDLLLAGIAGYAAHALVRWVLDAHDGAGLPALLPELRFGPLTPCGFVLAIAIVLVTLAYPGPQTILALALGVYALALARDPGTWLVVVPALLPVLDLAQWTGSIYIDEFDLLVMTTIAVLCFRRPRLPGARWPASLALAMAVALVLVAAGFASGIAAVMLDADTFASVHSPANAWRVGRGMLWCAALLLLVRRWHESPERDLARWARGMTIGLALVGAVMLWERTTFAGWTDFGIEYRAVGALAAASTAGAQTEAFLAAAIPFALLVASTGTSAVWRAIASAALLLAAYAITATVSRAAIAAGGTAVLLFSVGLALRIPMSVRARRSLAYLFPGTALLLGVAVLVAGERFSQVSGDLAARRGHWQRLVEPSADRVGETLFGHGLGTYPRYFYWSAGTGERPSLFSFRREDDRSYVRVAPGSATQLDQIVDIEPGTAYRVEATVRSSAAGSAVVARLCEKWILYSIRCQEARLEPSAPGAWQSISQSYDVRERTPAWRLRPTEKLSLAIAAGSSGVVDVTSVRLLDAQGRDHVRNGSFASPGVYWLVSAGDQWAWNTFSLFVEVVFEQGWIALFALLVALAYVLTALGRRATDGDLVATAFAAALAGFLIPSFFDALIDEPRMRLLLGLLVVLPLLTAADRRASAP